MPQEVVHINVRKVPLKLLLIALVIGAGIWSYYVVRWYIGNTLAEYFSPTDSTLHVAQMAATMAPNDPLTHWRIGQVSQKTLPLDQLAPAIAEYEKAVSLSPYDYRYWMALGTAHEQSGDPVKAELALKQAVVLAPSYAYPHWYLGNLYLRNGRYDEAFAELRRAAEADTGLLPQLFTLSAEIYGNDPEGLKNSVGQNSEVRAKFALYLLNQNRYEEGLRLWSVLSAEEKRANKETAETMVSTLKSQLRFHDALAIWNDVAGEKFHPEVGSVLDGSFEEPVNYASGSAFGWDVRSVSQMQIGIDPNKSHSGSRSLRLTFQVRANLEGFNVSQLVPVQPNTDYEFECYVATDKLETGSAPQIQILDATTGANLFGSSMAPGGTNDWTRVNFPFRTTDKTQAITIKIIRVSCGEETPVCPIYGSIWYDDFTLKRRN
ncbi:MAG TPA: tetratricopeptide repeat protein [Pyrinomonadaceae bacterium]|nr:tetratricopeptide repeat protein [Pyrinomonadaceae bacterium]